VGLLSLRGACLRGATRHGSGVSWRLEPPRPRC
jgi:hypothetical protein